MLKRINDPAQRQVEGIRIAEAKFPSPFGSGLEYATPARGTWNIVHTGMLIPEAHEIFVCAASCLRGVVLTAAEMNAQERFSTIEIKEHNLFEGDMEDLLIEGVTDILEKLPKRPPAVLVYTSCVHHFAGSDLEMIYRELRARFPEIDFTDCYMNPIMRKSGLTPDQLMRSRLYMLLKERTKKELDRPPMRFENDNKNRWNLLAYGDVVVHILHKDERETYAIEKFWSNAFSIPESEWREHSKEFSKYNV